MCGQTAANVHDLLYPSRPAAGPTFTGPPPEFSNFRSSPMALDRVPAGRDVPSEINVVIEIPMNEEPVKYEVDKATGAIFVDRVLTTPMRYPCNYGYVPHTLGGDGDPLDVLVIMPVPLIPGSVIRCRPVGMLNMTDEAGEDMKLIAVPVSQVFPAYRDIESVRDLPELTLDRIAHFFAHYKDLEKGKWVKIEGWRGAEDAKREINAGVERYAQAPEKPAF
jgi:inorganic pyrophosphatase